VEGPGARHGEVVDRAVDSERTEISAGKEHRAHDVGICRESEALACSLKYGGIVLQGQERIAKAGQDEFADQLVHQFAAATVSQEDVRVILDWKGTGEGEVWGGGHGYEVRRQKS